MLMRAEILFNPRSFLWIVPKANDIGECYVTILTNITEKFSEVTNLRD